MTKARIVIDNDYRIGDIDPRLYGSFIEHMGRAVYGGIHDPSHPTADENGFGATSSIWSGRSTSPSSISAATSSRATTGKMASDRLGPPGPARPRLDIDRAEHHRHQRVRNLGETGRRRVNMAVNLGTRGIDAARNLVEYCNHPGGTAWSDLPRHGVDEPHRFRTWCLGNEWMAPGRSG